MKQRLLKVTAFVLTVMTFSSTIFLGVHENKALAADPSNLCSDAAFVAQTLDANGIQNFLKAKGSVLAKYSEGGKSAAQIIADHARINGVNPYVILAMIQKEQSLITGNEARVLNQNRINWAMGYGALDGVTLQQYSGFTKQIENGVWQLKQNFDIWAKNGSKWSIGKTMTIDGKSVKFANRCTSAQYRYTPHLGQNFANYFASWNTGGNPGTLEASYVTQGPRAGAGAPGVNLAPNQRFMVWVNYRNTGGAIWYRAGKNTVRLGTSSPEDRGSVFAGGKSVRGSLVQPSVLPGQIGTFQIWLTAPKSGGTYTEKFRLVAEGIKWMGEEATYNFTVNGPAGQNTVQTLNNNPQTIAPAVEGAAISQFEAEYLVQGPRVGAGSPNSTFSKNQSATLWVNFKNTGSTTWTKNGYNAVHLGAWDPMDRNSLFSGGRRGYLVQNSVAPGQIGTFILPVVAPKTSGAYTETYRLVAEHITWFGPTASWSFGVR